MPVPIHPRFLSLVVHDLRNPLNAIDLSLQLIDQEIPPGCPELAEDILMVRENVAQVERMLATLADYSRLIEEPVRVTPMLFDPSRLVSDLLDEAAHRSGPSEFPPATLEVRPGCPPSVELDQGRAHTALRYVLANTLIAAEGAVPVRFAMDGSPDRLVISARVERPPHATLVSTNLDPDCFERLIPTPIARLGLDLTIAARISELFGGTARLAVEPRGSTTVILEWSRQVSARG